MSGGASTPLLEAKDLFFAYAARRPLFEDLSFSTPAGGFLSVVGPNGSGKTTLLKLAAGILGAERGELRLAGRPVSRAADLSGLLAYVPQSLSIDFDIGVLDFVLLGRGTGSKFFGRPKRGDVEIALRCLDELGLSGFQDQVLLKLSGGERQKVLIAKALAQKTDLILLDEPTSHLDLRNQIDILETLKRLAEEGKKIVAVLHDVNLAYRYSDAVVMMKKGRICASGTAEGVLNEESLRDCFGVDVEKTGGHFFPKIPPRRISFCIPRQDRLQ